MERSEVEWSGGPRRRCEPVFRHSARERRQAAGTRYWKGQHKRTCPFVMRCASLLVSINNLSCVSWMCLYYLVIYFQRSKVHFASAQWIINYNQFAAV